MANHKSAIKHWRKSLYRNSVNKKNKSILNTHIKKLRKVIKEKDKETATQLLPLTFSIIDRTVKKGAIQRNRGNRYKSRLSRQVELINSTIPK